MAVAPTTEDGFVAGDDYQFTVDLADAAGDPLDVSNSTFRAQLRRYPKKDTVLATADVDMTDAATGTVVFTWPSDETVGLPHTCWSDVEETDEDGIVTTLFFTEWTIQPEVSR